MRVFHKNFLFGKEAIQIGQVSTAQPDIPSSTPATRSMKAVPCPTGSIWYVAVLWPKKEGSQGFWVCAYPGDIWNMETQGPPEISTEHSSKHPGDSARHGLNQWPSHWLGLLTKNVCFLEISEFRISSLTYPTVGYLTWTMARSVEYSVPHQSEVGQRQQQMKGKAQWVVWWSQTLIESMGINQESKGT